MRKFAILLSVVLALMSCTSEKQTGTGERGGGAKEISGPANGSGGYSLEIYPKIVLAKSILSAVPTGFAISDARMEWLVNNQPTANATAQQFSSSELRKGDTVQLRALIRGSEVLSDQITIMNTPPKIIKVDFKSDVAADTASLRIEASGEDADGDAVTFLYEWTKNGEPAGRADRIEGSLKRGDAFTVKVIPFDGSDYGESTAIRRELSNMRPVIAPNKEFTFDGKMYTYQVKASDPDGDALAYSMASPVNGMTIDPASGLLQWNVPSEFKGNKDVSITVSDGHGGTATYNITITIQ